MSTSICKTGFPQNDVSVKRLVKTIKTFVTVDTVLNLFHVFQNIFVDQFGSQVFHKAKLLTLQPRSHIFTVLKEVLDIWTTLGFFFYLEIHAKLVCSQERN